MSRIADLSRGKRLQQKRRGNSLLALVVAVLVLGSAGVGLAFWATSVSPSATAAGGAIPTPSNFQATPGSTSVHLSWNAAANVTSYTLTGTLTGTCTASIAAGTNSCDATGLTPGTPYSWTLATVFNSWHSNTPATASTTTTGTAPAITSANNTTFTVGSAGTFTVTTTGSPNAAITNANFGVCTKSTLPSGVNFNDNGNGTATIAGTPASATTGTYTLCLNANNGVAPNATQAFTLTVNVADGLGALTTPTSTVAAGSTGNTITFTYTAASAGVTNGAVTLTVPSASGWSAPSITGSAAGFTTASLGGGTVGVVGQTITVSGVTLAGSATGTIVYGSTASGGPGATATGTTGGQIWQAQEKSTSGGTPANITSPTITVTAAANINFNSAGLHTLTVPAGVTAVHFTLTGAGGGGGGNLAGGGGTGGKGGTVTGTITLPSNLTGTVLTVVVGGGGNTSGTAGSGGVSGASDPAGGTGGSGSGNAGGGGGGASDIYVVSSSPIAVAGGGGGGGGYTTAAGGNGTAGLMPSPGTSTGGTGNTGTGFLCTPGTGGGGGSTLTSATFPFTITPTFGTAGSPGGTVGGTGLSSAGGTGGGGVDGGGGGGGGYASGGGGGVGGFGCGGGGGGGGAGYDGGDGTNGIKVTVSAVGVGTNGGPSGTSGTAGSATFTGAGIGSTVVYSATGSATNWGFLNGGTKAVTYPAGTNTNDLMFLVVERTGNTAPPAVAGWNQIADQGTTNFRFSVWWKLAAGESSVSMNLPTSPATTAWIVRYVRDGGGSPPNPAIATAAAQQGIGVSATTMTPGTNVTTNQALATVISFAGIPSNNTLSLGTAQGFAFENQTNSGGVAIGAADKLVLATGAVTSPTWSESTATVWAWGTVAFF